MEPGGTSVSAHGLGYLFTALRGQGLITDKLVLQLTTFLRSLDLFLELIVLTPGTLTASQVRRDSKQRTHNPELSLIHSGACLPLSVAGADLRCCLRPALRLFEEAPDRLFFWMVCFGVTVVVSIKTSRSAASQC